MYNYTLTHYFIKDRCFVYVNCSTNNNCIITYLYNYINNEPTIFCITNYNVISS